MPGGCQRCEAGQLVGGSPGRWRGGSTGGANPLLISIYSRYVLGEIAARMVVIVLIALLALLAERLLRVVDLVTAWGGSALTVVEMLAYLVPHYLRIALPAAFFLAVFLTFRRLSREAELDAMMSSGLGLHQFLRPIWGCGLVLMIVQMALVGHVEPMARYAYRARVHTVTTAPFGEQLAEGRFLTVGPTTYMAEEVSPGGEQFGRVFVYTERSDGTSIAGTADRGSLEASVGAGPPTLRLRDGVYHVLSPPSGPGRASRGAAATSFKAFETSDAAKARPFRARGKDERELTLPELWQLLDAPPRHLAQTALVAELHGQLIRTAAIVVLPLLAIPLALGRRGPHRSYGIVVGIAVLVGYTEIVHFGERLVAGGQVGPGVGLWLPFSMLAATCSGLFVRQAFGLRRLAARPRHAVHGSVSSRSSRAGG